ncbi:MAG TPA: SapC family protein [Desulfuromonadales bacterium]|nr:SapC family protein [Desulfuromonadales bacterium]
MKSDVRPLKKNEHLTHGWQKFSNYSFAVGQNCAPVLMAEVHELVPRYALAFIKQEDGSWRLIAVQGLHSGDNLYLDAKARPLSSYMASCYRAYPFALVESASEGETRAVLCFNHASGLYRENPDPAQNEERFFTDEGQLQPAMQDLLIFLRRCHENRQHTQAAVDALASAKLLEPWPWPFENPDSERPMAQGLHRIDQKALAACDGATLHQLQQTQSLYLAYAQILSMPRLAMLPELYKRRQQIQKQQPDVTEEDLKKLFNNPNIFQF